MPACSRWRTINTLSKLFRVSCPTVYSRNICETGSLEWRETAERRKGRTGTCGVVRVTTPSKAKSGVECTSRSHEGSRPRSLEGSGHSCNHSMAFRATTAALASAPLRDMVGALIWGFAELQRWEVARSSA